MLMLWWWRAANKSTYELWEPLNCVWFIVKQWVSSTHSAHIHPGRSFPPPEVNLPFLQYKKFSWRYCPLEGLTLETPSGHGDGAQCTDLQPHLKWTCNLTYWDKHMNLTVFHDLRWPFWAWCTAPPGCPGRWSAHWRWDRRLSLKTQTHTHTSHYRTNRRVSITVPHFCSDSSTLTWKLPIDGEKVRLLYGAVHRLQAALVICGEKWNHTGGLLEVSRRGHRANPQRTQHKPPRS